MTANDPVKTPKALRAALARYARRAPASLGLAAIVIVTSVVTGTLWHPAATGGDSLFWAAGVTTTIGSGWWWTPLTALFVVEGPVQLVVVVLLSLTLLALAERLLGTARTVLAFLGLSLIHI